MTIQLLDNPYLNLFFGPDGLLDIRKDQQMAYKVETVLSNIKRDIPNPKKTEDVIKIHTTFGTQAVYGWCEINDAGDMNIIRRELGPGFHHLFTNTGIPLSIPERYAVKTAKVIVTNDAIAGKWERREIVYAQLVDKADENAKHWRVHSHAVAGAWTNHPGNPGPDELDPWRKVHWIKWYNAMITLTTRLRATGVPVIVTADANRRNFKVFGPSCTIDTHIGFDAIGHMTDRKVAHTSSLVIPDRRLNTDHPAIKTEHRVRIG